MGIKTILNLRGVANQSHYLLEKEACDANDIALVNMKFSARTAAPKELYLTLLNHFDTMERPFLIHCKSGADRTGIAAAFYLLHVDGATVAQARAQLALKYVHIKWLRTGILDAILDAYASDLATQGPMPLRQWLETCYDDQAIISDFRK